MTARRAVLEVKIQREIELALGAEPDLLLLRNSVGEAVFFNKEQRYQVPYGLGVGSPDLVGFLRVDVGLSRRALVFALEVKCPGEDVTDDQEHCHDVWRRFGAIVHVVHSVDEARAALAEARRVCR